MANSNLTSAKKAKNDEFYTQYLDIEKEISAYLMYDADTFRGRLFTAAAMTRLRVTFSNSLYSISNDLD
jgi:hypothetical protein